MNFDFDLDEIVTNKAPNAETYVKYLFWDRGIDLNQFNKLPIPYILEMVQVYTYIKEQEIREAKKAQRKQRQ